MVANGLQQGQTLRRNAESMRSKEAFMGDTHKLDCIIILIQSRNPASRVRAIGLAFSGGQPRDAFRVLTLFWLWLAGDRPFVGLWPGQYPP